MKKLKSRRKPFLLPLMGAHGYWGINRDSEISLVYNTRARVVAFAMFIYGASFLRTFPRRAVSRNFCWYFLTIRGFSEFSWCGSVYLSHVNTRDMNVFRYELFAERLELRVHSVLSIQWRQKEHWETIQKLIKRRGIYGNISKPLGLSSIKEYCIIPQYSMQTSHCSRIRIRWESGVPGKSTDNCLMVIWTRSLYISVIGFVDSIKSPSVRRLLFRKPMCYWVHRGIPRNIGKRRWASRSIEEHWGPSRNIKKHRGAPRNIKEYRGTSRDIKEHRGTSRDIEGHEEHEGHGGAPGEEHQGASKR